MDKARFRATALTAGAVASGALLLVIDLRLPLGEPGAAVGGLPYLVLLGFGWFLPRPRPILGLGLLASLLVLAGWRSDSCATQGRRAKPISNSPEPDPGVGGAPPPLWRRLSGARVGQGQRRALLA